MPVGMFFPGIKRVKGIITITHHLKNIFADQGVESSKILVASDGVDLSEFDITESKEQCRKKLDLPQDQKIVLYTGHLYEWKGVDTLIKASKYLDNNVIIFLVGGTESDVKKYKIQYTAYNIQVMGHRPHKEIPYWLKAADVLILPNSAKYDISKYWTSPMKLFEYMASGAPIVSSDLPSIGEVLSRDNAVLVKPDNPESLAAGITTVIQSIDFAQKISSKALIDVGSYTWIKRSEKILGFFNELN